MLKIWNYKKKNTHEIFGFANLFISWIDRLLRSRKRRNPVCFASFHRLQKRTGMNTDGSVADVAWYNETCHCESMHRVASSFFPSRRKTSAAGSITLTTCRYFTSCCRVNLYLRRYSTYIYTDRSNNFSFFLLYLLTRRARINWKIFLRRAIIVDQALKTNSKYTQSNSPSPFLGSRNSQENSKRFETKSRLKLRNSKALQFTHLNSNK